MTVGHKLHIELIERRSDIPLSATQWNALLASNETDSVFQTYQWFDAWWSVLGSAHQLFFLVVRRGGDVIGFAPLMLSRGKWGLRELQFIGTGNADYLDFVIAGDRREALRAICEFLRSQAARWDRFWLCNIPANSASLAGLAQAVAASGLYLAEEARIRCPAMLLEEDRGRAQELINRYSVRRPLNWFKKRGNVSFRHVGSLEDVSALLPAFFEQHIRRWRAAGKPSLFEQARQRAFYASLATSVHGPGWLLFSVLELDNVPIAFHFGFDYAGSVTWYKPAFDMSYAEHSPGLLLTRQLIEDSLARNRKEIDFTIGEEQFKDRFANTERSNVYVAVYHSRLFWATALCVHGGRRLAGRAVRALRSGFQALRMAVAGRAKSANAERP
jgi:CelD/BcsL family acetyltransferase involved in cellulose biosynthesis